MPAPSPPPPQLDLFAHSADTMLRNDVLDALLRRDAPAAGLALLALREQAPRHPALPALATLTQALQPDDTTPPSATPSQALFARHQLEHHVLPAAQAQLGPADAPRWMAPLWRALAARCGGQAFDPQHADGHAAPLWLCAGQTSDWQAAEAAVQGIESWRRIPAPLGWMAVARSRQSGLDSAWPLLVELAWLAGARLPDVALATGDPLLARLLRRFDEHFDPGTDQADTPVEAWWPAWLLVDQPALLPHLRQAQAGQGHAPERCFRLLAELLGLERQGRHADLMAARKRLRDLQPALFTAYMQSR